MQMAKDPSLTKIRVKRGQCPTCGNQILKQSTAAIFCRSWKPIENRFASNGLCLLCDRAAAAVALSRAGVSGGNSTDESSEEEGTTEGVTVTPIYFEQDNVVDMEGIPTAQAVVVSSTAPPASDSSVSTTTTIAISTDGLSTNPNRRQIQIRDRDGSLVGDYDGEMNEQEERHGHGTMRWANGHEYDGQWKNNKRDGRGTYRWSDGDVFAGFWVGGLREGLGTCRFDNGATYTGEWKDDKMHGRGTYHWPDGQQYVGGFVDGLMEGEGHCIFANGVEYVGEYERGMKHGWGRHRCQNGSEFTGNYKNDCKDGPGMLLHAGGEMDVGIWKDGTQVGGGVRWNADQTRAYKLNEGKVGERLYLSQARMIAATLGVPLSPQKKRETPKLIC